MKKSIFTEREINAMKSLREATTIKAIAEAFGVSETTVSYHTNDTYKVKKNSYDKGYNAALRRFTK